MCDFCKRNYYDLEAFHNNKLFVKDIAIVNEYISSDNAVLICYCFN